MNANSRPFPRNQIAGELSLPRIGWLVGWLTDSGSLGISADRSNLSLDMFECLPGYVHA